MGEPAVVVGVDGSRDSTAAVEWALGEARAQLRPLVAVHCTPHVQRSDDAVLVRERRDRVDEVLRELRLRAAAAPAVDLSVRRLVPDRLETGRSLLDAVGGDDTLVIGSRGHGRVSVLVLGSVSHYLVRHARSPVVLVRAGLSTGASRVVVGFDATPGAERALEWSVRRAAGHGGEVVALHAWHAGIGHGWTQERAAQACAAQLDLCAAPPPDVRLVAEAVHGHAGHELAAASGQAGLVVLGSGRRGPVAEALLGSVTQTVLHHARSPVAVVPSVG